MVERERFQLVIALGEGAEGQRLREVLNSAAERTGKPVSVWARETLFSAAGDPKSEGPVDPIVEVRLNGSEMTLIDLRTVSAMQNGWSGKVRGMMGGQWIDIGTAKPDELVDHWKRLHRWGLI